MKKIATLVFLLWTSICFGNVYYVSFSGGNDLFTPSQAMSQTTPWKTIGKVNSYFASLVPGDQVLFKCGDVFYGRLDIVKSGNNVLPITIGKYGAGAKPIITGFTQATGFTLTGSNVWTSAAIGNTNKVNLVTQDGFLTAMGRWPNTTYRKYTGHTGNTQITDPTLGVETIYNWTGAEACVRELHDILEVCPITSHVGNVVNMVNKDNYSPINNYGWFVRNSIGTLDLAKEWYFNPTTTKISIYSTTMPTNVYVSTIDTVVYVRANDYITFDGIQIEGGNVVGLTAGMTSGQSVGINMFNSTLKNNQDGVYYTNNNNCKFWDNEIFNSQDNAMEFENEGGRSNNLSILRNHIDSAGMWLGMGRIYNGIVVWGDGLVCQDNVIYHTGHQSIAFYYDNINVSHNEIRFHTKWLGDCGAINVFDPSSVSGAGPPGTIETNRVISDNIISDGYKGEEIGTPDIASSSNVIGIYMDDWSNGVTVRNNTVSNEPRSGIYIHNGTDIIVDYNTTYNCGDQGFQLRHDDHSPTVPIRNVHSRGNTFFATSGTQMIINILVRDAFPFAVFNYSDENKYFRPIVPTGNIINGYYNYRVTGETLIGYTLATWKSGSSLDAATIQKASNTAATTLYDNPSYTDLDISVPGLSYKDAITDEVFNNTFPIPAWGNRIMFYNGLAPTTHLPPDVNAGPDKTITLPTSSVTLDGTVSQIGGTINYIEWTGGGGTIVTPNNQSTLITGLTEGDYTFTLTAENEFGLTSYQDVIVHVQPVIPLPAGKLKCNCIFHNINP